MSHIIQNPKYKNYFKNSNSQELIEYSDENHSTWRYLYNTQIQNLQDIAYSKMLECLQELCMPKNYIPQLSEISEKLYKKTGWQVTRVEELIDGDTFFQLLANRMFPSTIYIRGNDEASLSKDPDIFHELFGHCPILLDPKYASLFEKFGYFGLRFDEIQRGFFQRLFWFTFETGLVKIKNSLKIFGGSLLSSIKESRYAVKSNKPIKQQFDMINIFRTPYRADLLQPVYYFVSNFSKLYSMLDDIDLIKKNMDIAYELGEFFPLFPIEKQYSRYINYNICKLVQSHSSCYINKPHSKLEYQQF
jgi:phenylalanine-4-hydroxylase